MKKPYIIGFCGIDGSGKSTQIMLLSNNLQEQGFKVKISKVQLNALGVVFKLSEKLFGDPYDYHPRIPPLVVQLSIAYDFAYHYLNLFEEPQDYDFILCDRYKLCYFAYSMAYGVDMEWITKILNLVKNPDLTIYFNTPVEVSTERLKNRLTKPQRADEDRDLLTLVKEKYHFMLEKTKPLVIIDGAQSIEQIHQQVLNTIGLLTKKTGRDNIV